MGREMITFEISYQMDDGNYYEQKMLAESKIEMERVIEDTIKHCKTIAVHQHEVTTLLVVAHISSVSIMPCSE